MCVYKCRYTYIYFQLNLCHSRFHTRPWQRAASAGVPGPGHSEDPRHKPRYGTMRVLFVVSEVPW